MRLDVFRSLWGAVGDGTPFATMTDVLPVVAASGYAGVETAPFFIDLPPLLDGLVEHDLDFVAMVLTYGDGPDEHLAHYRGQLEGLRDVPHRLVVAHAGADSWDDATALGFLREALRIEADLGLTVGHETHRGRILFHPWRTDRFLGELPELRINCDYSHWVVVAERLLDEEAELFARCAERAVHIHTRVGYDNGPQVPDVRAPEWQPNLEAHERWWDMVWDAQERRGVEVATITPELGPPSYQQVLPWTGQPTASLVEMVDWMAGRQRERFAARGVEGGAA